MIAEAKLKSGVIYGDNVNSEYVYMPASEIGVQHPICIYEAEGVKDDVDMAEALRLIRVRSLRPTKHPLFGASTC